MTTGCEATRPRLRDPGWECTGRGLMTISVVTLQGVTLPIVLPRRALDAIEPASWWEIQEFTGGDHLHAVAPPPPPDGWSYVGLIIDEPDRLPKDRYGRARPTAETWRGEMYIGPADSRTWVAPV
jgi:hypothetical protein